MTTTEHLQRIKTKCEELLAVAEKRTPGEWETDIHAKSPCVFTKEGDFLALDARSSNATFIASCAGPAEAGWRATIAAIDGLEEMDKATHLYRFIARNIITAWPEELLK